MNDIKVGVGLYILNEQNKLLLGFRKSKHGKATWSPPGGHLEFGESLEGAAIRELEEETSLKASTSDIKTIGITNDLFKESNKHYITIHMLCKNYNGSLKIMEPDKWDKWEWFDLNTIPDNVFLPVKNFLTLKENKDVLKR